MNKIGSPSRTRTYDTLINSQVLLPTELSGNVNGAGNEIRTRDPCLGKAVLYRWAIPAYTTDIYHTSAIHYCQGLREIYP